MESGRAYDLFPFISAPVKCGFRKALVMSMISRAVIFEIIIFFMFAACSLLPGIHSAGRLIGGKGVAYRRDDIAHIDLS
jgi:hypothetical protein